MVVEVGDGGEGGANKISGVGFVVAAFTAYSVEKFAAEGQVGNKIDWGRTGLV